MPVAWGSSGGEVWVFFFFFELCWHLIIFLPRTTSIYFEIPSPCEPGFVFFLFFLLPGHFDLSSFERMKVLTRTKKCGHPYLASRGQDNDESGRKEDAVLHRNTHLHSCSLAVNGFIFLATCQLPVCLSIHLFVQTSILITTLTKFHRGCYRYQAELQGPCNVSASQCSNSHGCIRATQQNLSSTTTHKETFSFSLFHSSHRSSLSFLSPDHC